jgi:hypothetical protein
MYSGPWPPAAAADWDGISGAVVWKAMLSPDYLNGLCFRVTLITDPRLTDVTMPIVSWIRS